MGILPFQSRLLRFASSSLMQPWRLVQVSFVFGFVGCSSNLQLAQQTLARRTPDKVTEKRGDGTAEIKIMSDPASTNTTAAAHGIPVIQKGNEPASLAPRCGEVVSLPAVVRRLTKNEYLNTMEDLLGKPLPNAEVIPEDDISAGFKTAISKLSVSTAHGKAYAAAAEKAADIVLASKARFGACAQTTDSCADSFIQNFGSKAYRRPLNTTDLERLKSVYLAGKAISFDQGIKNVALAAFQSPSFLFRTELGDNANAKSGETVTLTPYETGSAISYLIWATMPDDVLLEAEKNGTLKSPEQVAKQVARMLASPKAAKGMREYFSQWLPLDRFAEVQPDSKNFPQFDDALRKAMREEALLFTSEIATNTAAPYSDLLTSSNGHVNAGLASHYGLSGSFGSSFTKVDLAPVSRAGVLTLPAFLTASSSAQETSFVKRGKFVRTMLLCQKLEVPKDLDISKVVLSPVTGKQTRREIWNLEHLTNPGCASCHKLIDPPGFALEKFDAIGRTRSTEHGLPIDSTGTLEGTDANGPFADAVELSGRLANSSQFRDCFATQWISYAGGSSTENACQSKSVLGNFVTDKTSVPALINAIATSQFFLSRIAQ